MVYTTAPWLRFVYFGIALVIVLSIASVPEGSFFSRFNAVSLSLMGICLFAALYLERWIFDRDANLFERNVGILLVYARRKRPLDSLQKVLLHETGSTPRRTAILSVVDRGANEFRLDVARGGSVREARRSAERLSAFCAIPLEDTGGDVR